MEKAREIAHGYFCGHCRDPVEQQSNGHSLICNTLTTAIAAAIKAEREACAEVAKTTKSGPVYYVDGRPNAAAVIGGDVIAAAIRARGGE
jgi:hypothetical protein